MQYEEFNVCVPFQNGESSPKRAQSHKGLIPGLREMGYSEISAIFL
jgi:hypothetical protein